MRSAVEGHTAAAGLLVEVGTQIDTLYSYQKFSALTLSAKAGHTDIVGLILAAGANIEILDVFERTALMWSAKGGH